MNEELMTKINNVLYYVLCPLIIIEFLLSDLHVIGYLSVIIIATAAVILALLIVSVIFNRNHPNYSYKVNNLYSKILVGIILIEVLLGNG